MLFIKIELNLNSLATQLILSNYLGSIAIGQIFWGFISEKIGRVHCLRIGASLFCLGSTMTACSISHWMLMLTSLWMGFGAASCITMARAIVNEQFNHVMAAKYLSNMTSVMVLVPMLGFFIGGLIVEIFGWRLGIAFVGIFGFILTVSTFTMLDSRQEETKLNLSIKIIGIIILHLLSNHRFLIFCTISSLQAGIFFSFHSFLPYQFYRLGLTPTDYGVWFSLTSAGYFLGNLFNRWLTDKIKLEVIIFWGCAGGTVAILFLLISYLIGFEHPLFLAIPLFFFGLGNGLIIANCLVCAMKCADPYGASASGILGAVQFGMGSLAGSVIIIVNGDVSFSKSLTVILSMSFASFLIIIFLIQKQDKIFGNKMRQSTR